MRQNSLIALAFVALASAAVTPAGGYSTPAQGSTESSAEGQKEDNLSDVPTQTANSLDTPTCSGGEEIGAVPAAQPNIAAPQSPTTGNVPQVAPNAEVPAQFGTVYLQPAPTSDLLAQPPSNEELPPAGGVAPNPGSPAQQVPASQAGFDSAARPTSPTDALTGVTVETIAPAPAGSYGSYGQGNSFPAVQPQGQVPSQAGALSGFPTDTNAPAPAPAGNFPGSEIQPAQPQAAGAYASPVSGYQPSAVVPGAAGSVAGALSNVNAPASGSYNAPYPSPAGGYHNHPSGIIVASGNRTNPYGPTGTGTKVVPASAPAGSPITPPSEAQPSDSAPYSGDASAVDVTLSGLAALVAGVVAFVL